MLQSHIIDIDGTFVGIAIRLDKGFRFIAIDPRLEELGETIWPALSDIDRLARRRLAGIPNPDPLRRAFASGAHSSGQ
ncbi:MAG TPA: hypothetical protein VN702_19820 [Acetobacteraceae bacterium]|nr:hypothetical protein [Acetobacteraceae bacterium]